MNHARSAWLICLLACAIVLAGCTQPPGNHQGDSRDGPSLPTSGPTTDWDHVLSREARDEACPITEWLEGEVISFRVDVVFNPGEERAVTSGGHLFEDGRVLIKSENATLARRNLTPFGCTSFDLPVSLEPVRVLVIMPPVVPSGCEGGMYEQIPGGKSVVHMNLTFGTICS